MLQNISSVGQQFLANLETLDQNMATTQEQLSSGFVINKPSDNPAALGDMLQLESELGHANQVSTNLGTVSGEVNTAESALETATQLMLQAQSLGRRRAPAATPPPAPEPACRSRSSRFFRNWSPSARPNSPGAMCSAGIKTRSLPTSWI